MVRQQLLVVVTVGLHLAYVAISPLEPLQSPPEEPLHAVGKAQEDGRLHHALHVGDQVHLLDGLVQPGLLVQLLGEKIKIS